MRLVLLASLLCVLASPTSAQGVLGDDGIYVLAESAPAPVGGMAAIADALVYPDAAIEAEVEGTVVLMFVVLPDGSLSEVTVARAPHPALGEAALAAVASVAFTAGVVSDEPVATRMSLPLRFVLPEPVAATTELAVGLASSPAEPIGGWDRLVRAIEWPDEAAGTGVEGVFTIAVDVDEAGHVTNAEITASGAVRGDGRLGVDTTPRFTVLGRNARAREVRTTVDNVRRAIERAFVRALIPQRFIPEVRNGEVVAGRVYYSLELYIPGR